MKYSKYFDHTLLKSTCTQNNIENFCNDAITYDFASVCVNSYYVRFVAEKLAGSSVKVCTVVGFPIGQNTKETKIFETQKALNDGAHEIDMVLNIAAFRDGRNVYVADEIREIAELCHSKNAILKVIIESSILSDEEIIKICGILNKCNIDFAKTSTGFADGGATIHAVKLMRECLNDEIRIKASTGINDADFFMELIEAGASRMGSSKGIKILNELEQKLK